MPLYWGALQTTLPSLFDLQTTQILQNNSIILVMCWTSCSFFSTSYCRISNKRPAFLIHQFNHSFCSTVCAAAYRFPRSVESIWTDGAESQQKYLNVDRLSVFNECHCWKPLVLPQTGLQIYLFRVFTDMSYCSRPHRMSLVVNYRWVKTGLTEMILYNTLLNKMLLQIRWKSHYIRSTRWITFGFICKIISMYKV